MLCQGCFLNHLRIPVRVCFCMQLSQLLTKRLCAFVSACTLLNRLRIACCAYVSTCNYLNRLRIRIACCVHLFLHADCDSNGSNQEECEALPNCQWDFQGSTCYPNPGGSTTPTDCGSKWQQKDCPQSTCKWDSSASKCCPKSGCTGSTTPTDCGSIWQQKDCPQSTCKWDSSTNQCKPQSWQPSQNKCTWNNKQYSSGSEVRCDNCQWKFCTCMPSGEWGKCRK
jgi:hypothetical protein